MDRTPTISEANLPDDFGVLKQMIAELLRALREERRDRQEVQQRLDALLKRLYGPRPEPINRFYTSPERPVGVPRQFRVLRYYAAPRGDGPPYEHPPDS